MRTHGWGGDPPRTDDEARTRILEATRELIDSRGGVVGIADVARTLGVTRQTVYRYFASSDELLTAIAVEAVGELLDRMAARLDGVTAPDVAVVDGLIAVLGDIAHDNYVGLMLRGDSLSVPVIGRFTGDIGHGFARTMMGRMSVDWSGDGYREADLEVLAEIILRALQSFLLDDAVSTRPEPELRAFIDAWVGAAIRALPANGTPTTN